MISGGHGLGDTEGMTEGAREGGSELWPAIRNEFRGKTEAFPDVVTIQVGRAFGGDIGMARGKNGHLSDVVIDKDGNSIESLRWGKGNDEIHRSRQERSGIFSRDDGDQGNGSTI